MNYDEFVAEYGDRPKDIVYIMAVTLERKRILAILEKEYPAITTWQCWKALKEGK